MDADMERVAAAGRRVEASRTKLADAALDRSTAGERWEREPTEAHRAEALSASRQVVEALLLTIAYVDQYLECGHDVLPARELDVVRYGRTELANDLVPAMAYVRKIETAPRTAG